MSGPEKSAFQLIVAGTNKAACFIIITTQYRTKDHLCNKTVNARCTEYKNGI